MKKLPLLVVATLLISLVGCGPSASNPTLKPNPVSDFEYSINREKGTVIIEKYIGTNKDVVVPSEIEGFPVKGVEFAGNEVIETVVLPDTIEVILGSFMNCANLQSVVLGENVTDIWDYSFYNCPKLKTINFPASLKRIGLRAFKMCSSLEKAILPHGLESIEDEAFSECAGLKEVFIPNTVAFKGICTFYGAEALSKLTIEQGTASLGQYGCFMGATSLKTLTIPASVKSIPDICFAAATSLETVIFEGDAPVEIGDLPFGKNENLTIYYNPNTNGWDNTLLSEYNLVSKH